MAILIQERDHRYVNNVVIHVEHAQELIQPVLLVQGRLEIRLLLAPVWIGIMMMAFTQIVWLVIIRVWLAQTEIRAWLAIWRKIELLAYQAICVYATYDTMMITRMSNAKTAIQLASLAQVRLLFFVWVAIVQHQESTMKIPKLVIVYQNFIKHRLLYSYARPVTQLV